jgi:hypothetical protein
MGWIYSAELGESPSHSRLGSSLSPTVRTTDTLKPFFCRVCKVETYPPFLSGTMCKLCGDHSSISQLISSRGDFPARISALQALEQAWQASEAGFFSKSSGSLASYDPNSFSWKTSQLSLIEDLNGFVWSSLRWGMIVAGRLYQPRNLAPVTCERGGGFVPTPTARDYKSPGVSRTRKANVAERRGIPLSVWFKVTYGTNLFPGFVEWMMGYDRSHTALKPWATAWYRSKRAKRSKDLQASHDHLANGQAP